MTTVSAKPNEVKRQWFVVDASEHVLGRLASEIAKVLMGKHKPQYTRHVDTGDCVVVVNCEAVQVTGNKMEDKVHYWHTGFPGGIKSRNLKKQLDHDAADVLVRAVKRMLPRNKLGRQMLSKLHVYQGGVHPHAAQQPVAWDQRLEVTAASYQEAS